MTEDGILEMDCGRGHTKLQGYPCEECTKMKPTHELFLEQMAVNPTAIEMAENLNASLKLQAIIELERAGYSWIGPSVIEELLAQSTRTEPITKAVAKLIEATDMDTPHTIALARREMAISNALTELRRVLETGER